MPFTIEKRIPDVEDYMNRYPLPKKIADQILDEREILKSILRGDDHRKILIIGPCSAWPHNAVVAYAKQLHAIATKVQDKIKIVMRVYTQKPRTTIGWTGSLNQPNPLHQPDIEKGIAYCRTLMIEVAAIGLPIADEALFTHNEGYFADLLSYVAIGARSSEDQEHRVHASMLDMPVGLKNPTSGNILIGINGVIAAQYSHVFLHKQKQIKSHGNLYAHLILRGGDNKPNIDYYNLNKAVELLQGHKVKNPAIIVDVSHDNSVDLRTGKKDPLLQPHILMETIANMKKDATLFFLIKGFMVESFIKTGKQAINHAKAIEDHDLDGLSITDACLGITETKAMIEKMYDEL